MSNATDRQPLTHRIAETAAPGPLSRRLARRGLGTLAAEEECALLAELAALSDAPVPLSA